MDTNKGEPRAELAPGDTAQGKKPQSKRGRSTLRTDCYKGSEALLNFGDTPHGFPKSIWEGIEDVIQDLRTCQGSEINGQSVSIDLFAARQWHPPAMALRVSR